MKLNNLMLLSTLLVLLIAECKIKLIFTILYINNYFIKMDQQEIKEKEETGFGTEYHDGSGFDDCDPTGKGNRICKDYPKDQWCSECIYLDNK